MKVADVRRNLVPDTWTADGECALPELGPCSYDLMTTAALVVEERNWRRPDTCLLNLAMLLGYAEIGRCHHRHHHHHHHQWCGPGRPGGGAIIVNFCTTRCTTNLKQIESLQQNPHDKLYGTSSYRIEGIQQTHSILGLISRIPGLLYGFFSVPVFF